MVVTIDLREEDEAAAAAAMKAIAGRSDEEVLAAVLARKGGPVPFLQAAIDVAQRRSDLFLDPSAPGVVAEMAVEAQAKAEAEERRKRAKGEPRKAEEMLKEEEPMKAEEMLKEEPRTPMREAGRDKVERAAVVERVRGG